MSLAHHSSIATLRTRFHLGALLFVIAISLALQYLLNQYADARAQAYLAGFRVNAELKTKQIDLRFRLLADHVLRLRKLAEQAYDSHTLAAVALPALQATSINDQVVGYGLRLSDEEKQTRGNFYAQAPLGNADSQRELAVAWSLFGPIAAQHQLDDAIRWSGIVSFHSGNWAAYPFQTIEAFLSGAKETTIRAALLDQYQSEYFVSLRNSLSQHGLLWRSPSLDQAGSGYIVSIFAPVYHASELQAYVLADVQLDFVTTLLRTDLPSDMHVQIVTDAGELIADSDGSHPAELRSKRFYQIPDSDAGTDNNQASKDWQLQDHHYALILPLSNVSWQARTIIDKRQIARLVSDDIRPLKKGQVFLIAVVALLWWLLARYFVSPSLLLADLAARQDIALEPRLPRIWQDAKTHLRKLITERRVALRTLESERAALETQVRERTRELQNQNTELEAFNFTVSHDMRAPLRAVDGFITALQEEYGKQLDEQGQHYVQRAKAAISRMEELIEALLALSQIGRAPLQRESLNLADIANRILTDLALAQPERTVHIRIQPDIPVQADKRLIQAVLENLLANAWKYTSKTAEASIEFHTEQQDGETVYIIADNGAGFDMAYAKHLFAPFQRMHRQDEFEGTGVGLSTVQRIVHRHGGRIWAEAAVGQGAKFSFTLP